jgi:hypothetical protein
MPGTALGAESAKGKLQGIVKLQDSAVMIAMCLVPAGGASLLTYPKMSFASAFDSERGGEGSRPSIAAE